MADHIHSKAATPAYLNNHSSIFGEKKRVQYVPPTLPEEPEQAAPAQVNPQEEVRFNRVAQTVHEMLGADKASVTRSFDFIHDGGADSLDLVELVMALEEEFEIEISDEKAETLHNVGDVLDYLKARNCG